MGNLDSQRPSSRSFRARATELAIGHTANKVQEYGFDYLLYPFAIFKLGVLYGGLVMSLLSLLVCLGLLKLYDWTKRDCLGIEAIKSMKEYQGASWFGRATAWTLRRSDWLACLLLSIKFDPFITTAYLRHGAFNGMSRRDWRIFLASWFVGNLYWTFLCFSGVSLLEWLWRRLP